MADTDPVISYTPAKESMANIKMVEVALKVSPTGLGNKSITTKNSIPTFKYNNIEDRINFLIWLNCTNYNEP
eukprot:4121579-Ditylum_brightwellii.AAC.1